MATCPVAARPAGARDRSTVSGSAPYRPGVTPCDRFDVEPASRGPGARARAPVKQVVHRSNSRSSPAGVADDRALVQHARRGVERLAVLEEAHRERGGEGAERDGDRPATRAPGRIRRRPSGSSRPPSSPKPPWHRQTAASWAPSNPQVAHVGQLEGSRARPWPRPRGRGARSPDWSTPTTSKPRRAAPGNGARDHTPRRGRGSAAQPQRVDQEVDLLLRALRERIAQVGRPEEVRDRVEPAVLVAARRGRQARRLRPLLGRRPVRAEAGVDDEGHA